LADEKEIEDGGRGTAAREESLNEVKSQYAEFEHSIGEEVDPQTIGG